MNLNAFQRSIWNVFLGMHHRDATLFRWMIELFMISNLIDFKPAIRFEQPDNRATVHVCRVHTF